MNLNQDKESIAELVIGAAIELDVGYNSLMNFETKFKQND